MSNVITTRFGAERHKLMREAVVQLVNDTLYKLDSLDYNIDTLVTRGGEVVHPYYLSILETIQDDLADQRREICTLLAELVPAGPEAA